MSLIKKSALIIIFIASIAYATYQLYTPARNSSFKKVAILLPAVHPSMHAIEQGFSTTLKHNMNNCSITVFNANGDKVLMKGQVEKITNDSYDLIFTVGTTASQMTKTALTKKNKTTPLLFAAISDPVKRGIVNPNNTKEAVTGVIESYDYNDQVNLLLEAKPATKHIVIVYDPSSNPALEELKLTLQQAFANRGITTESVAIYTLKDLQQKVPAFLTNADVLVTLTDHTVCSGMDMLIKLCTRSGVTLFTSELDSNDKGAALSYGVQEADYGKESAQKAYEILHNKKEACSIPITALSDFTLLVNTDTAKEQGVTITETLFKNPRIKAHKKGNV